MLSNSSVVVAGNLSEILTDRGLVLVPKTNTLVAQLSNAVSGGLLSTVAGMVDADRDMVAARLVAASTGPEEVHRGQKIYQNSSHDTYMDNYVQDLSTLVSGYISFARSVVNKEVTRLKETLQDGLSNYKYKEPEEFFNVSYFKLNDVFSSYLVTSEVGSYQGSSSKFFFEPMTLGKLRDEGFELGKYLLTGDAEQDQYIVQWLAGIGENRAKSYLLDSTAVYAMTTDEMLDYALVGYLFYRNLTQKADLDLGYTATTLRSKASGNRDYFGNQLAVALELYRKDIRNGRLLSSNTQFAFSYFNDKPLQVKVYEENFRKLVEAGLNIEVVFGYIASASGGNDITVDELIQDGPSYLSKWGNTRSLYLLSVNSNRLNIFKQILTQTFEASLARDAENADEKEFLAQHAGFVEETRKLGVAYIEQLHTSDIDDLDRIALELVAKIRYRFTNSYFILREMQEILEMDDDIEPSQAALYATIRYITDFLLEHVDVVRV